MKTLLLTTAIMMGATIAHAEIDNKIVGGCEFFAIPSTTNPDEAQYWNRVDVNCNIYGYIDGGDRPEIVKDDAEVEGDGDETPA